MGRAKGKLKLEYISDKKTRQLTFKRRNENLVRKIKELTQLCEVDGCMIVYSPDHHAPVTVCGDVRRMAGLYRAQKAEDLNSGTKRLKTFGVSDFHNDDEEKAMIIKNDTAQLAEKPGELKEDYSSMYFDYGYYQQMYSSTPAPPLMLTMTADEEDVKSSDQKKCCAVDFDVKELDDEYWAGGYLSQLCDPPPQPVMLW